MTEQFSYSTGIYNKICNGENRADKIQRALLRANSKHQCKNSFIAMPQWEINRLNHESHQGCPRVLFRGNFTLEKSTERES